MDAAKSASTIVLDAAPILQNDPSISTLIAASDNLVTVPSVISEIKDPSARSRVDTSWIPFLTIRSPVGSSLKFVSDFARKTGDLPVLSKTDIEVLALAYEIECEKNGGDWRLRRIPGQQHPNGSPPERHSSESEAQDTQKVDRALENTDKVEDLQTPLSQGTSTDPNVDKTALNSEQQLKDLPKDFQILAINDEHLLPSQASASGELQGLETEALDKDTEDSEPSDSEGWITPSNIRKHKNINTAAATSSTDQEGVMKIATITTDFAMQNVLLQIGLNLISPSLKRVRNIRTYILRCHACFEKVKDMSKQFCPRCGKPTLTRVSCSTNANGKFQIHLKKNMQWNHRGDRYSIPKPTSGSSSGKVGHGRGGGKGGWGQGLILTEDQKEYQRAVNGHGKKGKGTDLMDEDYLPGILTGERRKEGQRPRVGAGRGVNSKRRS